MQSHIRSKQGPLPLPWGYGSMARHGYNWWLTWRDAEGEVHYENSNTPDAVEAQRILARKALARARAMVEELKAIADGKPYHKRPQAAAGSRSDDPAAGKAGSRAHGKSPARTARISGNDPRQKSQRKGEAAQ